MKTFNFYEPGELELIHGEWYIGLFNTSSFGISMNVPSKFTVEYDWMLYDKKHCPYPSFVCYSEDKTKDEYGKLGNTRTTSWITDKEIKEGWYFKLGYHIPDHYDEELLYYMTLEEYNK